MDNQQNKRPQGQPGRNTQGTVRQGQSRPQAGRPQPRPQGAGNARPQGATQGQRRPQANGSMQARPQNGPVRRTTGASQQGQGQSRSQAQSRPVSQSQRAYSGEQPQRQIPKPQGVANTPNRQNREAARGGNRQRTVQNRPTKAAANKKSRSKGKTIAIFAAEFVALLCLLGVVFFISRATDKDKGIQKYEINEEDIVVNDKVKEQAATTMSGYKTIALFGVDTTNGSAVDGSNSKKNTLGKGNRTDTIMIACLNQKTGEIKLLSVYRDTYLNLSNDTYNKANSAYAKGGPEMAINMLNMNLDLSITDYVTIGFGGLIKVIDELGGIEIDVKEKEIEHLNNYQISIVGKKNGKNAAGEDSFTAEPGKDYIPVTQAGPQVLNGLQATAYCRIRYVGNDFMRTERQRTVLTKVLEKAKKTDVMKLTGISTSMMSYIQTSLGIDEITSMLGDVAGMNVVGSDGFPYEEYRDTAKIKSKGDCVVPVDLETNVIWLHNFLYEDASYIPSEEVKRYSSQIATDITPYRK